MTKVPSVYTRTMMTIYLSLMAQVAEGTFFRKSPFYYIFGLAVPVKVEIFFIFSRLHVYTFHLLDSLLGYIYYSE